MKNRILLTLTGLFLLWSGAFQSVSAQFIDTVIHKGFYDSYFSFKLKNPVFVKYTLKKGGGDCDRKSFSFKATTFTAHDADYKGTSYDKGHLVNAEDFAFDCTKDKETFWYYNCVPQTANLNRGIWKKDEEAVREQSQNKTILVLCGSVFSKQSIGDHVGIPQICWKVAQDTQTGEILLCRYYTNNDSAVATDVSVKQMEKLTKVKISAYLKK